MQSKNKILWIALFRGIGDAVLFYPALKRCMEIFPSSEIGLVLVRSGIAEVFKIYDFKGQIFIKPKNPLLLFFWLFKVGIKRYSIVFDASSIEQMHITRWLTWIFSRKDRVGYHFGSSSWLYNIKLQTHPIANSHQKDIYAELLKPYGEKNSVELSPPPRFRNHN